MGKVSELRVSELYAFTQGNICEGKETCHYCMAPCDRKFTHKDPPPIPFARTKTTAKKPESPWECIACWLWRRKRVTVDYFSEGYKDGKCLLHLSTLISDRTYVLDLPTCKEKLYETLLCPPLEFSLSFLEDDRHENLLQLQELNKHKEIKANTELKFTVNNILHTYTVHELEETLIQGDNGRMPGARAILRILGPLDKGKDQKIIEKQKAKRGRPTLEEAKDPRDGKQYRVVNPEKPTPA